MRQNFGRMMQMLAMQYGNQLALVNVERDRRYSYSQLHLLTNRIANALRDALQVGRGDTFMLILENDSVSLLQFPAILKQEGTVALTNLRDSLEEHTAQAQQIKPKVAFIENSLLPTRGSMLLELGCKVVVMDPPSAQEQLDFPQVLSFWQLVEQASEAESDVVLDQREHLFMLRYTGGTTGRGKCAMYSVDNWFAGRDSAFAHPSLGFDADMRMLHAAPLSHGSQLFFYPTFFAGGTNVTMNTLDLEAFRMVVEAEAITHTFLVPTALYRLLELQRANPRKLSSLRTVLYGAAPMSPSRLNDLIECFGRVFAQAYAATEVPVLISILQKEDHRVDTEQARRRMASAGRVTPGVEVFVADEDGKPVSVGKTGEIWIRGRGVTKGYQGNAVATSAEFIEGAWRSGDLGCLDADGFVYIVDRLKDMIISGGFNVYAVEVEAALAAHPAVLNSAVVGVPHADWGESVHAEVQLREGKTVTEEELMALVKDRLGGYKSPKSIAFVQQLPVTAVGKVLRRLVREKYWQGQQRRV